MRNGLPRRPRLPAPGRRGDRPPRGSPRSLRRRRPAHHRPRRRGAPAHLTLAVAEGERLRPRIRHRHRTRHHHPSRSVPLAALTPPASSPGLAEIRHPLTACPGADSRADHPDLHAARITRARPGRRAYRRLGGGSLGPFLGPRAMLVVPPARRSDWTRGPCGGGRVRAAAAGSLRPSADQNGPTTCSAAAAWAGNSVPDTRGGLEDPPRPADPGDSPLMNWDMLVICAAGRAETRTGTPES